MRGHPCRLHGLVPGAPGACWHGLPCSQMCSVRLRARPLHALRRPTQAPGRQAAARAHARARRSAASANARRLRRARELTRVRGRPGGGAHAGAPQRHDHQRAVRAGALAGAAGQGGGARARRRARGRRHPRRCALPVAGLPGGRLRRQSAELSQGSSELAVHSQQHLL